MSLFQNQEEKNIKIFFSKNQLRLIQNIEGNEFFPRYVIINGKKTQYTEIITTDRNSNFSDAKLLYNGPEKNITIVA